MPTVHHVVVLTSYSKTDLANNAVLHHPRRIDKALSFSLVKRLGTGTVKAHFARGPEALNTPRQDLSTTLLKRL